MGRVVRLLNRFVREDDGLETVEYAIIAGLIVVGTIVTIASIGVWVNTRFQEIDTALATGSPSTP